MKENSNVLKVTVFACIAVLYLVLIGIVFRIFVKNILYEKMGIYNKFVEFIMDGDNDVKNADDEDDFVNIDWASIYPYDENDLYVEEQVSGVEGYLKKYKNKINSIKGQIEWYTSDGILFQTKLTEMATGYENIIGWKVQEQDYDAVITLRNGHLTCICPPQDVEPIVESVKNFKSFLSERNIDLCYVSVPFKIDDKDSQLPLGIEDESNKNVDKLLNRFSEENIDFIDLRACEKEDEINHYGMFYYTDHHWTSSAAVWACDKVAKKLHTDYGYEYDGELFDKNNYDREIYKDVFLGSYGRRVTLSKAAPEDFEILFPKKDMNFNLVMVEKNFDRTGKFADVFIDYDMLKITDYYQMDAYSSFVTLRKYVAKITNEDAMNQDKKILILRDSFGNNFAPYFSQQYGTVEVVDVSLFTGSIKSYIEESKPDMVLLLYNPTMIEPIDYSSYTSSKFDFR